MTAVKTRCVNSIAEQPKRWFAITVRGISFSANEKLPFISCTEIRTRKCEQKVEKSILAGNRFLPFILRTSIFYNYVGGGVEMTNTGSSTDSLIAQVH